MRKSHEQQRGFVTRDASLATGHGRAVITIRSARFRTGFPEFVSEQPSGWRWQTQPPEGLLDVGWSDSLWGRCGFAFHDRRLAVASEWDARAIFVGLPLWAALLVLIDPAYLLLRRARRYRREARGQCPACGYDLRFSPERCPECGGTRKTAGAETGSGTH